MDIKLSQVESRIMIEADGKILPDIFSGYQLKSSNSGESELVLIVRGCVRVSELSTNLKVQKI